MKKINNLLINAALLLVSIISVLAVFEVLIYYFSPQHEIMTSVPAPFFIRFDNTLGWANREGATGLYKFTAGSEPTKVRINDAGFRGRPVTGEKGLVLERILILGDSNAFGYGIEEGDRFSALLENGLPEGYEVINLGVYGYGTDQELILFENRGVSFAPDLVVLALSAGDLSDNMNSINSWSSKPYFKTVDNKLVLKNSPVQERSIFRRQSSRGSQIKKFLYSNSGLYRFIFNRLSASNIFMPYSVQEMSQEEGMETTVRIISRLNKLCLKAGCRLVVLLISHEQLIAASVKAKMEIGYFPELKMHLSARGISYIDSSDSLSRAYEKGEALFLDNDPVHLNKRGNEIVADDLYKSLLRLGYISKGI